MRLLKCLRTADERAEDFLLDEDGFPDDLKELVEKVSLDVLEDIIRSPLGNLLLPSTIERLKKKKDGIKLRIEPESKPKPEPEPEQIFFNVHAALGDLSLLDNVKRPKGAVHIETTQEEPDNGKLGKQLEAGTFAPSEDADDIEEFHDAYSALRAAERAIREIHVRLLTRGEGPTEKGVVQLIAEAVRIIGCARELGANESADKFEQELSRILNKFGGTIS